MIKLAEQSRLICLLGSSLTFALLAAAVSFGFTDAFDAAARAGINRWAAPHLTALAFGFSFLGSTALLFALTAVAALCLLIGRRRRSALMLVVVFMTAVLANNIVKLLFLRARPEAFFGIAPDSYSFASGHALLSACFYGVVAGLFAAEVRSEWQRVTVWVLVCTLIIGVGLSRVYLGVHHPTDVLAGFALAAFIICAGKSVIAGPP